MSVCVGVWWGGFYVFPLLPLWDLCIIQETLTEPCTSLYIFGTKLHLPSSHKEGKVGKTGGRPLKIHPKLCVAHPFTPPVPINDSKKL